MSYTVFLSGSRKISRLNDDMRIRVDNITMQDVPILIGDANGADKALQTYLAKMEYKNVTIFTSGNICRNNVGGWKQRIVLVSDDVKGRQFYEVKDRAMALEADYGFVIWDGKSSGSVSNVLQLLKLCKPVIIYFGPRKSFHALKTAEDVRTLMTLCDEADYREINRKTNLDKRLKELTGSQQGNLDL